MAVIKVKLAKIVPTFLALVQRDLITPMLVTRLGSEFFTGALDDTVTLRTNGLVAVARDYEFRTRTAPIVLDDIQGGDGIPVKLDTHLYSATGLTDEQLRLDEINFATEVLGPQAAAVAARAEGKVVSALNAATFKRSFSTTSTEDPLKIAVEAKRLLDSDKVAPYDGRYFLVGSNVAANWVVSDRLSKYDSTGQTGTPALREAVVGRLAGSPVVISNALDPNAAFYLHSSAFVLGNVAPVAPRGASFSSSGSDNGWNFRWLMDYDANYLRDRSIVSSFMGVTSIRDERNADGTLLVEVADDDAGGPHTAVVRQNVRGLKITISGLGSVL